MVVYEYDMGNAYIEIPIRERQIKNAERVAKSIPQKNNFRPQQFGSNRSNLLTGFIGEQIVADHFGVKIVSGEETNYDMVIKNWKVDVKSSKCTNYPQQYYECRIDSAQEDKMTKQKCDLYIFTKINMNFTKAWILGFIEYGRFWDESVYIPKGEHKQKHIKRNGNFITINELYGMEAFRILVPKGGDTNSSSKER